MSEEKPGKSKDGLDWKELEPEIKGLIKERNPWRGRKVFLVTFVITCLPTFLNIGLNILSVTNFIKGTTYNKYVSNFSHCHNHSNPSVNNSLCTSGFQINHFVRPHLLDEKCRVCTYVNSTDEISDNSNDTISDNSTSILQFECFERDPIWGYASLVIMFF